MGSSGGWDVASWPPASGPCPQLSLEFADVAQAARAQSPVSWQMIMENEAKHMLLYN